VSWWLIFPFPKIKPLLLPKAEEEAGNKEVLRTTVTFKKIQQGRIGGGTYKCFLKLY